MKNQSSNKKEKVERFRIINMQMFHQAGRINNNPSHEKWRLIEGPTIAGRPGRPDEEQVVVIIDIVPIFVPRISTIQCAGW